MKILISIFYTLIALSGVVVAYFGYIAFDAGSLEDAALFLAGSLALISFGLVMLIQTSARQKSRNVESHETNSVVVKQFEEESMVETDPEVKVIETKVENIKKVEEEIKIVNLAPIDSQPIIVEPTVEIKEDPKLLFDDWYVDEFGLYIDVRLIGITNRKTKKILRKLTKEKDLSYQVDQRTESITIYDDKNFLGTVPELYRKSILTYIHWIESIHLESITKRSRDVHQCIVRIRFKDELREKLQKRLQQSTWH